jgi:predicted transcriptional regulator
MAEHELVKSLAEAGYDDLLLLRWETAREVLTDERMDLIEHLQDGDVDSIEELARRVERDPADVSEDLNILFKNAVIDFEEEEDRKIPVLQHENIFIKPII